MHQKLGVCIGFLTVFALAGCGSKTNSSPVISATPSTQATQSAIDLAKSAISDLFYQDQVAYSKSLSELYNFQVLHTYPGVEDFSVARNCFKTGVQPIPFGVPDLTTVREDPTWLVPVTGKADKTLPGPSKGTTYIVTENSTGTLRQVHGTLLNGKAYYFPSYC